MQVGEHTVALLCRVETRSGDLLVHQRQLARAQLKVLVVVTLGRLFARGGHLGETREAAM